MKGAGTAVTRAQSRYRVTREGYHSGPSSILATRRLTDRSVFAAPDALMTSAWRVLWLVALGAGAWLRYTQLPIQVLVDDEWHAVHKLLHSDAQGIVTSFGLADYSIPLTLYDRFLALHGGLTEWAMHVPMLVSGIALLVVAPLLLRRAIARPVAVTWVALLAVSPLLVYLSRTARPYALTCLLSFIAVLAFRRWWSTPSRGRAFGAVYVAATFLAGWLHIITLPFTLLPFAWYGVRALTSEHAVAPRAAAIRRLVFLGIATAVPLAAALVPPLIGSLGQLTAKAGNDTVTIESAYRTLLMMSGIRSAPLLVLIVVLLVVGMHRFWRRDADFVGYVAMLVVGTAIAIVAARPAWIHHPGVLARYLLPALPFALLFVAEGAVAVAASLPVRALPPAAIAFAVALLVGAGPIPSYLYRPNQFMGHARFQFDYDPAHNPYVQEIPDDPIPAFYRELAKRKPASLTLIEAPWRLESNFDPFPWYQQVHRQYVKIGLVTPVCGVRDFGEYPATATGLRFRYFVHLSEILAGRTYGADYLVMHTKPWKTPPDAKVEWPDVAACLPRIIARLGAPVYRDDAIVVFDLRGRNDR
jgi:hypothetical protein